MSLFVLRKNPKTKRERQIWFLVLYGASFVFASFFIFSTLGFGYKPKPQFLEIGLYYPLSSIDTATQTVTVGDESQQVDYILDRGCENNCFAGKVSFLFTQKADKEPSKLTWTNSPELRGSISVKDETGSEQSDGGKGIVVEGETLNLSIIWSPPADAKPERAPLRLPFFIELSPRDAAPRFLIQHIAPKPVSLPEAVEQVNKDEPLRRANIYLTSSRQPATLQVTGSKNYIPVLQVGKNGSIGDLNAFLELSDGSEENCDFIVNNGLRRTCFSSGARSFAGTDKGVVFTIVSPDRQQPWLWFLTCLILWCLSGGFFFHYLISRLQNDGQEAEAAL
ncbi:MAG TPA: hypothetical protein VF721_23420, partial [Pyrinomonadaceae bacterium]